MAVASTLPVAVVIPCFNDGATVREAVESALAEGPAELVVVNDGSTDPGTLSVLASLRAAGTTVIDQVNRGVGAARMRGVEETTSSLVMALDADDMLAPGALRAMTQSMVADPGLDIVWGDVESCAGRKRRLHPKAPSLDPWRITFVNELVASTVIRRVSLLKAGGWRSGIGYEDWDLWMAMAERAMRGKHVGRVTLHYRRSHSGRHSSDLAHHGELLSQLRMRHRELFERRPLNRRSSNAPPLLKLMWSAIARLPLGDTHRRYALMMALALTYPRSYMARVLPRAASKGRGGNRQMPHR